MRVSHFYSLEQFSKKLENAGKVVFPAPPLCPLQCVVGGFLHRFCTNPSKKTAFLNYEKRGLGALLIWLIARLHKDMIFSSISSSRSDLFCILGGSASTRNVTTGGVEASIYAYTSPSPLSILLSHISQKSTTFVTFF